MPTRKLSELDIERTCTQLLELDGWRALKTDPCSDRSRGKGFGEKGMADHLYLRYLGLLMASLCNRVTAQVLWVEFKAPKGRVSQHQTAWHEAERARGALTWIAGVDFPPTIEGFFKHYAASGLMCRNLSLSGPGGTAFETIPARKEGR